MPITGSALDAYWRYEQSTEACFGAIAVARDGASGFGRAAASEVKRVFWKGALPVAPNLSLLGAVEAMNAALEAEDLAAASLLQRALDDQLGYYTMEQEADDLGLVWLAKLGVAPTAANTYWFDYAKQTAFKHLASRFDLTPQLCERLYRAQPRWTEGGLPVRVPIGSFGDVHHSPCYRIYNIDQRLKFHPAPLAADLHEAAASFGGTWEQAVSHSVAPPSG